MVKQSKNSLPLKGLPKVFAVATIIFLVFAIGVTVWMSQQQQNIQQEAASSSCQRMGGTCKDVIRDNCTGRFVKGLCPGSSRIQCCLKKAPPKKNCSSVNGTCIDTNKYRCTISVKGLCPGGNNIICCTGNYFKK